MLKLYDEKSHFRKYEKYLKITSREGSAANAVANVRSVEAVFRDAFVTLCYVIQAQAKFVAFATNSNLEDIFDEASLE